MYCEKEPLLKGLFIKPHIKTSFRNLFVSPVLVYAGKLEAAFNNALICIQWFYNKFSYGSVVGSCVSVLFWAGFIWRQE